MSEHPWVAVIEFPTKQAFVDAYNRVLDLEPLLVAAYRCDLDLDFLSLITGADAPSDVDAR